MPDYAFYTGTYLGEDIPEADFARYAARAQRKLARMRQLYRVTPAPGPAQCGGKCNLRNCRRHV